MNRYGDLSAAQAWGVPSPSVWHDMDKDDKLDILAWYEVHWRMSAVNEYEAIREARRKPKRRKP